VPAPAATDVSALLVPGTRISATEAGYVLTTADGDLLRLNLDGSVAEQLLDALVRGGEPPTDSVAAALDALRAAGHTRRPATPCSAVVEGDAPWAADVRDALVGLGLHAPLSADHLAAADDTALYLLTLAGEPAAGHPSQPPPGPLLDASGRVLTCWADGPRLLICPRRVCASDVAARLRSARRHRRLDVPRTTGRVVTADGGWTPPERALAVAHVAAEAARRATVPVGREPARADHLLTLVDLRSGAVARHPVLPVPPRPS
jgi:hypothetical protein